MKTVCLTGHKGFIGKQVYKDLIEKGYKVIGVDIKEGPQFDLTTMDLSFLKDVDVVIHLAAYVGLVISAENPVMSAVHTIVTTRRLCEACVKYEVDRFIYASTWAVKGKGINPYDIDKGNCEKVIKNFYGGLKGLNYTILRFGTAYGKNMREQGVIQNFINKAKKGEPLVIQGRGDQIRQFTEVSDLSRGILLSVEADKNDTFYLVSDEVISINELAEMFGCPIDYKPAREADEDYEIIDISKTVKELGWKPEVKLKDGIEEMKNG